MSVITSSILSRLKNKHLYIFLLNFFLGWGTYNLKLVSLVKLIENLSIEAYPVLMFIQSFVFFFFIDIISKLTKKTPKTFYLFSMIFAGLLIFAANFPHIKLLIEGPHGNVISCLIFIASTLAVVMIELSVKDLQTRKINILKNPNISGQLCFTLELGIVAAALFTLSLNNIPIPEHFFSLIPFIASLLLLLPLILQKEKYGKKVENKNESESVNKESINTTESHTESNKVNISDFPFIPSLLILFLIILSSKYLQSFAVILGIIEFKETNNTSIPTIFSIVSLIQTGIILCGLIPSLFKKNLTMTWGGGVQIFFIIQSLSMFTLIPFGSAIYLVGTGMLRKLTQHIFLNKSLPILDATIPLSVRFRVKSLEEKWGQAGAYLFVAFVTAPVIFGPVPKMVLWLLGAGLAILGLFFRKKLLKTLNDFQVAHLVDNNVFDAIGACYSLANKESSNHYMALVNILKNRPRALMAKAIIFALGKMSREESVPYITNYYKDNDREDVQVVTINALKNYPSHQVDLFYKKALNELILRQTTLGSLRVSVFKSIFGEIPKVSILTVLELLEKESENSAVLANTIILVGEMAKAKNDNTLYRMISKYLDDRYPRRIRTNAILYLFEHKKYKRVAREALDTFLTSKEFHDRTAVAFLAGELKLSGLLPFIIKNSNEVHHKNSTLLVSLMKLNYLKSAERFLNLVLELNQDDAIVAINQFYTVKDDKKRYLVYDYLLSSKPEMTGKFLELLRVSRRDFDKDRKVIRVEAENRNIPTEFDDSIFTFPSSDQDTNGENVSLKKKAS